MDILNWEFYTPWAFVLLLPAGLLLWWGYRRRRRPAVRFSSVATLDGVGTPLRVRLRPLLMALRVLAVVLLIAALARPREGHSEERIHTRGVILELVVDRSGSMEETMLYQGQEMSRLAVVKQVARDFVLGGAGMKGRPNDLIGLVTFAKYAETTCPLVHAHDALLAYLDRTRTAQREEDGTAIGAGLSLGVARLVDAAADIARRNQELAGQMGITREENDADVDIEGEFKVESKAIILLTDGVNNQTEYDPLAAADFAKEAGIKVYTIGIGSAAQRGGFFQMGLRAPLDERLLTEIANRTGGFYGRADNAEQLEKLFARIDAQEKSEIESVQYRDYDEKFGVVALAALAALALEMMLAATFLRKAP